MTNRHILAIALLTAFAAGCGGHQKEAGDHAGVVATRTGESSSSAGLPDGNVAAGEKLASTKREGTGQSCVDCHGAEGNAPIDASYPKLAGQYPDYLSYALVGYRSGKRDNALMVGQAKDLTDQQIADLAAYFGSRQGELVDLQNAIQAN